MEYGISGISSYVPAERSSNIEKLDKFSIDETFLKQKIGYTSVAKLANGDETSDLAARAVEALLSKLGLEAADVDALILCTQNPDGYGLPHCSAIVHQKLGLGVDCACFDISLGCSGYIYAVNVAIGFAQANGFDNVVVVTADPYSKVVDISDKNTSLLFGDAATASLISCHSSRLVWRSSKFYSDGRNFKSLHVNSDRKLVMNGRSVFNFCATVVPQQISSLLQEANLSHDDIQLYLLHQGSKYIVDTIVDRIGVPSCKVPRAEVNLGNTVSSSVPILLERNFGSIGPGQLCLLSGFGVGLSSASAIFERKE